MLGTLYFRITSASLIPISEVDLLMGLPGSSTAHLQHMQMAWCLIIC